MNRQDHNHEHQHRGADEHAGHQEAPQAKREEEHVHGESCEAQSQSAEPTPDEHSGHEGMEHAGHDSHADHPGHGSGHGSHGDHTGHETMFRQRFWISLVLSIPVLVYSPTIQDWLNFTPPIFAGSGWVPLVFSVVVFAYGGIPFLQMAAPELRTRTPGMMTLISMAITVAFGYSVAAYGFDIGEGFFWELVTLIDVMLLGHWLEMRSVRQASGALGELAKLMPDMAERISADGNVESVRASELATDDVVLVRPGASVPADGVVVEGESELNESMITGESAPVAKGLGDELVAGTVNGDGSLRVRVTAVGEQTALAGIMRMVQEAQNSKSRTQLLADRAAGWLFYAAVAIAGITAVAWLVATGFEIEVLSRVVTVLVVACPHALGLAIPLVVAISTAMAAGSGVLVRDRLALEEARSLDMVVFDKTGTLTRGEFGVVDQWAFGDTAADAALAVTAAIEGDSEHTIAAAIRREAESQGLELPTVSDFTVLKGRGVRAVVDGETYHVGGPRLLEALEVDETTELRQFTEESGRQGRTVIHLVRDGQVEAAFALADVVRPESREAVDRLRAMGIEVAMLTGDSEQVAAAVAAELGIDAYFAEVLPENKDQKIAELQASGRRVAMVGDGINDSPALARADIGIAIGSGTNVAIESAGIVLVRSNPLDIVKIVSLSKATYRKMVQNLVWATGYNVFALPLAAGVAAPLGFLPSPALGAVFMSLSTIIVAINAQLLRRAKL